MFEVEKKRDKQDDVVWCEVKISIAEKAGDETAGVEGRSNSLLYGKIEMDWNEFPEKIKAETAIKKNRENGYLPPGTGKILYIKMLDFISKQAEIYHRDVFDLVQYEPSFGLTEEKWLKIFGPILEERGYKMSSGKNTNGKKYWGKIYNHKP